MARKIECDGCGAITNLSTSNYSSVYVQLSMSNDSEDEVELNYDLCPYCKTKLLKQLPNMWDRQDRELIK